MAGLRLLCRDFTPRAFEQWSKIAVGTICAGDTYGGGWVHALFTRRPWRSASTSAPGMAPVLGWVMYEKELGDSTAVKA